MPMVASAHQCDVCGIPVDAEHFDVSGMVGRPAEPTRGAPPVDPFQAFRTEPPALLPRRGEETVLAVFELHPQYCGVLTCFAQFTDLFACDNTQIATPGFEWLIRQNGKPIFPYTALDKIINPWGYNNFAFIIRLDENSRVEMAICNRSVPDQSLPDHHPSAEDPVYPIRAFAGRLTGRYWYNRTFGAGEPRRFKPEMAR